jgi:hypothetical protein
MTRNFNIDEKARVSFAVIAVIILIGATVTGAYIYSLSKQDHLRIDVPVTKFSSMKNSIDLELLGMARNALLKPLPVFNDTKQDALVNNTPTDLMSLYRSKVDETFENSFIEKFNGTHTFGDISVSITLQQPALGASFATPTFDSLKSYSEMGPETETIPVGFGFNATVDIFMKDIQTGTITQFSSVVITNISTLLPSAIYLYNRMDLSTLDSMIVTMVQAILFARAYGTYGEEMGYRLDMFPKPGENFTQPKWAEENDHIMAFGSDVGPVSNDSLLSAKDVDLIKGLTFILVQIRYFGTFDAKYAEDFLKEVRGYSLSDEGRQMTQQDLAKMIGTSVPNFVNVEALALELFHRMGRIPVDVDLVAPMFKKLMDLGIMSMVCTDWVKWFGDHFSHPKVAVSAIFGKSGWLDPTWMATDLLVGMGYEIGFEQYMSLVFGFILEAYHIDKPTEIRAFVQDALQHGLKDNILKDLPATVKVPPGSKWGLEIKVKDIVGGLVDKAVDIMLDKLKTSELLGMSVTGYILIYLFINEFQRPDINTSLVEAKVLEVYNNWTTKLRQYITDQNLTLRHLDVNHSNSSYVLDLATINSNLDLPLFKQYSTNSTINTTIQSTVHSMDLCEQNLSLGQTYMAPDKPFFIYGQGNETDNWKILNSRQALLKTAKADFEGHLTILSTLRNSLNSSSPDYPLVNNSLNELVNCSGYLSDALGYLQKELDFKWELNLLEGVLDKLNAAQTNGSKASALYESLGLLSGPIQDHPRFVFLWTTDEISQDIANISSTVQDYTFTKNGSKVKMSIKDLLNDKRGILGMQNLVMHNIIDIKDTFVVDLKKYTTLDLIENNSAWASHKTYDLANERLLNEKYNESLMSLHLMKNNLVAERSKYANLTPKQLWAKDGNLKMYAEMSYVDLEIYMVDVLLEKIQALQTVYLSMELHPGWAATFHGLTLGTDGKQFPILNISLNYTETNQEIHFQGLRVFNNTTALAPEDILFEYLNPFSHLWQEYYLTLVDISWSGKVRLGVDFNDTNDQTLQTGGNRTRIESMFYLDYAKATTIVTPEPIVDIKYAPTASLLKSLRSVKLDRNVFSKTWNKANVNFTFAGSSTVRPDDNKFKVQVVAYVRSLHATWNYGIGLWNLGSGNGWKPANVRFLTKEINVTDNGENDNDPADGKVSVKVDLDLNELMTPVGPWTLTDQTPLLVIKVWRSSDFLAQLSADLLGSSAGEKQHFSLLPYIEVHEQGYFYFDYTEDPMIGVYDVGAGDKEVDVPLEISADTVGAIEGLPELLKHVTDGFGGTAEFPKDNPRFWGLYNLTCEFKAIKDIPSDSAIVVNKGMPLLVDFDRDHLWLRDVYLGLIGVQKNISEPEEMVLNIIAPRKTVEYTYIKLLPPSEYKFALIYDFIPIYIQYFQGYAAPLPLEDILSSSDVVLTWEHDRNPDYAHIPYRLVPLNIDRSMIPRSLWYSFMDDLSRENLSINLFVYDIMGFMMREIGDIGGILSDVFKLMGPGSEKQLVNITSQILKYFSVFQKAVSDTLKTYKKDIDIGRIVFASPGAKAKMDLGGYLYLGFDVATVSSNETIASSRSFVSNLIEYIGLWYDIKTVWKVTFEIMKYVGYYQGGMDKFGDKMVESVEKLFMNYQTYLTLVSKYYQSAHPSAGNPATKFKPAVIYSIQQKYKMTDAELTENNDLAWKNGYSVVDVSYLRHRNKFTLEQLEDLKAKSSYSAAFVHGLSCVVDLTYDDIDGFLALNFNYSIWPGNYCNFGKRSMVQWQEVRDAMKMGIGPSDLVNATNYNIPYSAMMLYMRKEGDASLLVDKVKIISRYPGHDTLLEAIKNDPDYIIVLESAYLLRNDKLVIMPLGKDGPDLVLPDTVAFGLTYNGNGKSRDQSREFIESKLPSLMNTTEKKIFLYIDLRFGTNFDRDIMKIAVNEVLLKMDKDGQVQKVTFISSPEIHTFIRTDKGLKELRP